MNLAIRISALFSLITCLTLLLSGTDLIMTAIRSIVVFLGVMIIYYLTVIVLSVIKKNDQTPEQATSQTQQETNKSSAL
ncbi:MAG TPA: hypothetical protein VKA08_12175 [Balneolales bacterium]|nr:hypothetical protein [Balneolales bacterium]